MNNPSNYSSLPLSNPIPTSLSASSSLTNLSSHNSNSNSSLSLTLPKIDFEPVEFGPVAEGCLSQLLVYINVTNVDALLGSLDVTTATTLSLDLELPAFSHWSIEPVDLIDSDKSGWSYKPRKSSILLKKINKVSFYLKIDLFFIKIFNIIWLKKETLRSWLEQSLSLVPCDSLSDSTGSSVSRPGTNRLSLQPISRFHQFYVRLDVRNVSLYRDLIESLGSSSSSSSSEQFDPLLVHTHALVHFTLTNPALGGLPAPPKRYSLDRIDIKFILGYARIRSADQIEFSLPETTSSSTTSILSTQTVTFSNTGNIPVEIECNLIASGSSGQRHKPQQSIRLRQQYEIKVDGALLSLPARAKSKESTRLLMCRLSQSTTTDLDLESVRLCVEVMPSGYKHELPVRIRPQAATERRVKSAKISSTRTILFFGACLNPSSRQNRDTESGVQDEFVIANQNETRLNYRMSIEEDAANEAGGGGTTSSFVIVAIDKELKNYSQNGQQFHEFALEPKQQKRLAIRYRSNESTNGIVVLGALSLSIRECDYKELFLVQLVAFRCHTPLVLLDQRALDCK